MPDIKIPSKSWWVGDKDRQSGKEIKTPLVLQSCRELTGHESKLSVVWLLGQWVISDKSFYYRDLFYQTQVEMQMTIDIMCIFLHTAR